MDSRTLGITNYQLICVIAGALGTINSGWNIGVVNIPGDVISNCSTGPLHYDGKFPSCIQTSSTIWGIVVGCFALGMILGAIVGIPLSDRYGRKTIIIWFSVFSIAGALVLSLSVNLAMLIVGRILVGITAGASNGTLAVYISEITTIKARNFFLGSVQMACAIGIVLSQTIALRMSRPPVWRGLFSITGALGFLTIALFLTCVESPKWLIMHGRNEEASDALKKLRKGADIDKEFEEMLDTINSEREAKKSTVNIIDVVAGRTPTNLRHQLVVVSGLMFLQQMCGINAVIFYSTNIFNRITDDDPANIPTTAQTLAAVIVAVAAVAVLASMFLCLKFGRRLLMLASFGAMMISCMLIVVGSVHGIDPLVIAMVFIYTVSFNIGAGPIPWSSASEITPTYASAAFNAIGNAINYIFTFAIGVIFPPLQEAMGDYTFLFFMAFNAVGVVFCFFLLPETKDRKTSDVVKAHSVGLHNVLRKEYDVPVYI